MIICWTWKLCFADIDNKAALIIQSMDVPLQEILLCVCVCVCVCVCLAKEVTAVECIA